MKLFSAILCVLLLNLVPQVSHAKVRAFACEPEWAALLKELGGKHVSVYQATSPLQDPHYVEARPSLVARMRRADLVVCSGSDLEVGWLPLVISSAGNTDVQPGRIGYFMASEYVERLDVPDRVDRSMGDIHPQGNPHVHLDARNLAIIANVLAKRLALIDSSNAGEYEQLNSSFQAKWARSIRRWERDASSLKGMRLVTYHRDSIYLAHWLGLELTMTIESKPGIPPSARHLAGLLEALKREPADVITRMAYNEPKAPQWLSDRTGIPVAELPYTVGGTKQAEDLYGLFDDTIERLRKTTGR